MEDKTNTTILANDEYLTNLGAAILDMEDQIADLLIRIKVLENKKCNCDKPKHSPLRNSLEDFYPDDGSC